MGVYGIHQRVKILRMFAQYLFSFSTKEKQFKGEDCGDIPMWHPSRNLTLRNIDFFGVGAFHAYIYLRFSSIVSMWTDPFAHIWAKY